MGAFFVVRENHLTPAAPEREWKGKKLDFLWFFLVSRQERTYKCLFAILPFGDATFHSCSLVYA